MNLLKHPKRISLLAGSALLSLGVLGAAYSYSKANQASDKYTPVTLEIVQVLKNKHFKRQNLDDELSKEFLDSYLERLDPNKAYFINSDIAEFSQWELTLDDMLNKGDNTAGFFIYSRFRDRFEQRMDYAIKLLANKDFNFDFTLDENIMTDVEQRKWGNSTEATNEFWRKRIKAFLLSEKLAGKPVEESRETLLKRYQNQLSRVIKTNEDDIYELYINSFTELYDPHTSYLAPRSAENFNINMSLSLEGIGAVLQSQDEKTKVVRLVPGGPADKQGELKPADLITGVGQEEGSILDVVGWRLDEVVDKIRGPKNSIVRLQVEPADPAQSTKVIEIKRDKVKLEDQAAQKAVLEIDYQGDAMRFGVIDIPNFYLDFAAARAGDPSARSTTNDVARLLVELSQENIDGLIIDLRDNGGGSLREASRLTDLFIGQGPIVQIGKGKPNIRNVTYNSERPPYYQGPLIVLINRLSASASEIFAGAIQDYNRGLIVGSQSFGKGTVQTLVQLRSSGDLKITESKFYRVSGESTQHRGVVPDVLFPELLDIEKVGESSYDTALEWSTTNSLNHDRYIPIPDMISELNQLHNQRVNNNADFIYLADQKALIKQYSNNDLISLNEKKRLQQKAEFENNSLAIENKKRIAKGETKYENYTALETADEAEDTRRAAASGATVIDVEDDALLIETGFILADFIDIRRKAAQTASTSQ